MNRLLQIEIRNQNNNQFYNLLGFRSSGDDRSGIHITGFTLYDTDTRMPVVVDDVMTMKNYTGFEKLLEIKVLNQTTGGVYRLLGFNSKRSTSGTIHVSGFTLHDIDNRIVLNVNDAIEMKKYSLVIE